MMSITDDFYEHSTPMGLHFFLFAYIFTQAEDFILDLIDSPLLETLE